MTQIRITALRHSAFYSPLLITMVGGFLNRQGLDYVYDPVQPGQSVPERLLSGEFHLAQSAVATGFEVLERGEESPIVHFAQINERDGFFLAGRQPQPQFQWGDLAGKEVLVDHLFQPLAMLKYLLHQHNVDFNTLKVIDAGDVAAMDKAFREGRGDYVHQQGPAPQQLEQDGVGHIVASIGAAIGPVAFSSLCCTREWLRTDMAKAFMRAYQQGRTYVVDTEALILAQQLKQGGFFRDTDTEVLRHTIDTYKAMGCWSYNTEISPEAYHKLVEIFQFNGLIKQAHAYERLIATIS
ncbi:MAG: ABC transporter substrate-binding protein [Gammaproteobacteria bacterium]|nr:ABC transporter substrate-binding protein [Gammaproteobacteria bacterium]MDH5801468.1 ABC transporter substrate-binding protein [Gammaproteobacteria bacterium]